MLSPISPMLPLCCSGPCCPCSGLEPVISGSGHTLSLPPADPWKNIFATQCYGEMRGKVCSGQNGIFANPSHPSRVLPAKLLKMVCYQWSDPKNNSCLIEIKEMGIWVQYLLYLWEGKEDLCLQWLEPCLEKILKKMIDLSLHKSDKGWGTINTCAHPPSLKLFFILISDFKSSFLTFLFYL